MKFYKWILSLALAAVMVCNGLFMVYAASGDTLTLSGDILDAIGDIEYGLAGYRFDSSILTGAAPEDEVYLAADIEYEITDGEYKFPDVGGAKISLVNFRLEGPDAGNYTMPEIAEPVEKEVNITQRVIHVSPARTWLYTGQAVTADEISEIADYSDRIISGDTVNLTVQLEIRSAEIIDGQYVVTVDETVGCDNGNYTVRLDNPICLEVRPYHPEVSAEISIKEISGQKRATLTAPEGYLISQGNQTDESTWSDFIEVELGENTEGDVLYYLRNNVQEQTEYYCAISEEKTCHYALVQIPPEIQSISIEKADEKDTLNFEDSGVFGNGSVNITVEAVGTTFEQETKIYLGEDGSYDVMEAAPELREDGNYYYTAVFSYDAPVKKILNAYAENSGGAGQIYTLLSGVSGTNLLVLDNAEPEVKIVSVDGNYQRGIKAEASIEDADSGIAKVEYLWDTEFQADGNTVTDFVEYEEYSADRTEYEFFLSWEAAMQLADGCHTLHLRVTDKAGNVCSVEATDAVGSDMFPPEIKTVEVREAADSVFRFLHSSYFSNKDVEIAVIAEDTGTGYQSGMDVVALNDYVMQENGTGEYVLTVSPDTRIDAVRISAVDKVGWSATRKLTYDSDETGLVEEINLVVENTAPTVSFDFEAEGYMDNQGQIWFGTGDDSAALTITAADREGTVNSGLFSLIITDNGNVIYENSFSDLELESVRSFLMSDFAEGEHRLEVTAEDNAGNICNKDCFFIIDRTLPVSGGIIIDSPESVRLDEEQWFDGKDVITFRIAASDADSGLKSIELDVNGQIFHFEEDDFRQDGEGNYVTVNTEGMDSDGENRFIVTGKAADYAGNVLTTAPVTAYLDKENPSVSRITVEKKSNDLGKGLNVLSHGVYANDTLVCRVYAADEEFGSGIDYVTWFYEGLPAPEKMTAGDDGVFFAEIPAGEDVFEKEIIITAYDRYGKESENYPLFTDAEDETASGRQFVMIENIKPVMSLKLPEGEGETREDGQIWYQSNKAIELSVQDENSGIYHISFTVNGVEIDSDKNGADLLKAEMTRLADAGITEELNYFFDTDYFTETVGEAADGKYLISVEIADNAGNIEAYETAYYIDKTAPRIDRIDFSAPTSDGSRDTAEFIEGLVYGYYFKSDFKITVYTSDELPSAGLDEIRYRFVPYTDGVRQEEITGFQKISDGRAELAVPAGFKGQIFVEAFDNVGNASGEITTRAYVIDNTAPDIMITKNVSTPYRDAVGNELYVSDNSITVEIIDKVSGIREIGYAKSAELDAYDRLTVQVNNGGYKVGDDLGDGWIVSATDANLVTGVTRTFLFAEDDNDVILSFDATDNALNAVGGVTSDGFTIDKTNPIINVSFRDNGNEGIYYSQNRIADITVIERNFDEHLIDILIENTFGQVPGFSFTERSTTEHAAVIEFDEGDYTFQVKGEDLGSLPAIVNYSGGNENLFFVDKTRPAMEENFDSFLDASTDNSFNCEKTVTINVTEHNFEAGLTNLYVYKKAAGAEHNAQGMADVTSQVLSGAGWTEGGDVHTLSFTVGEDAVYRVELAPSDLAGNVADIRSTAVFEIDRTAPVVTAKNGAAVSSDNTEFLDIYPYFRRDDPAPTVEFEDLNIDHIDYTLTVYIPDDTSSEAETVIRPEEVFLEEDVNQAGRIEGSKFVLPDFAQDGVYALELTAVDVAGNESLLNVNTYARMVDRDVLAYIMESNPEQGTGLYSFQYQNGDAISKRPDNFSDIKIFAVAKKDTDVDIVLRDNNGQEYVTNAHAETDDSVYGMVIYYFTLEADFFKENFQDDTDVQLRLTVKNEGNRVDLGNLHIDNIAPDCDLPEDFKSWKWFYGEENRTITISNISELLDESQCRVYDNGREIEFQYSSESNTMEFTLAKGWHNVGIVLSDTAGNTYNIQERTNIHIGFFWSWIIGAGAGVLSITAVGVAIYIVRKRAAGNRE